MNCEFQGCLEKAIRQLDIPKRYGGSQYRAHDLCQEHYIYVLDMITPGYTDGDGIRHSVAAIKAMFKK